MKMKRAKRKPIPFTEQLNGGLLSYEDPVLCSQTGLPEINPVIGGSLDAYANVDPFIESMAASPDSGENSEHPFSMVTMSSLDIGDFNLELPFSFDHCAPLEPSSSPTRLTSNDDFDLLPPFDLDVSSENAPDLLSDHVPVIDLLEENGPVAAAIDSVSLEAPSTSQNTLLSAACDTASCSQAPRSQSKPKSKSSCARVRPYVPRQYGEMTPVLLKSVKAARRKFVLREENERRLRKICFEKPSQDENARGRALVKNENKAKLGKTSSNVSEQAPLQSCSGLERQNLKIKTKSSDATTETTASKPKKVNLKSIRLNNNTQITTTEERASSKPNVKWVGAHPVELPSRVNAIFSLARPAVNKPCLTAIKFNASSSLADQSSKLNGQTSDCVKVAEQANDNNFKEIQALSQSTVTRKLEGKQRLADDTPCVIAIQDSVQKVSKYSVRLEGAIVSPSHRVSSQKKVIPRSLVEKLLAATKKSCSRRAVFLPSPTKRARVEDWVALHDHDYCEDAFIEKQEARVSYDPHPIASRNDPHRGDSAISNQVNQSNTSENRFKEDSALRSPRVESLTGKTISFREADLSESSLLSKESTDRYDEKVGLASLPYHGEPNVRTLGTFFEVDVEPDHGICKAKEQGSSISATSIDADRISVDNKHQSHVEGCNGSHTNRNLFPVGSTTEAKQSLPSAAVCGSASAIQSSKCPSKTANVNKEEKEEGEIIETDDECGDSENNHSQAAIWSDLTLFRCTSDSLEQHTVATERSLTLNLSRRSGSIDSYGGSSTLTESSAVSARSEMRSRSSSRQARASPSSFDGDQQLSKDNKVYTRRNAARSRSPLAESRASYAARKRAESRHRSKSRDRSSAGRDRCSRRSSSSSRFGENIDAFCSGSSRSAWFSKEAARMSRSSLPQMPPLHKNGMRTATQDALDKIRAGGDRRILYVGKIPEGTTRSQLRGWFSDFGTIQEVSVHFRETGDNYGFVTFENAGDAYQAVEKGTDSPGVPFGLDLCFGGRREFCGRRWRDLDGQQEISYHARDYSYTRDFDSLLESIRWDSSAPTLHSSRS